MEIRPIIDTLREIRDGAFLNECSADFNALIGAIAITNKGGELVIKIKVDPGKKGNADAVYVTGICKIKEPGIEQPSTLFFTTPEGNLSRRNPRQKSLPGLIEVDSGKPCAKDLDAGELATAG